MNKKIILTGDRPTGSLHLGHYIGSLKNRVKLQNEKDTANSTYKYQQNILIADMQALTDHFNEPEKISSNILEVVKDYLAVGIDPSLTTICQQSALQALSEYTMYFLNLLTLNQVERNPTVKEELKQKNFSGQIPMGFLIYPVSQAADILAFDADLVPVGADQLPMIEDTNTVVRKFNATYGEDCFKECTALIPENFARLVGIDGKAKMSKSLNNAIFLKDDSDTLWQKVRKMYTDPDHIKVEDPGKIEGNTVFSYLDAFNPDVKATEELKAHYQRGGLGDMKVKKYLFEVLDTMLKPIRDNRIEISDADAAKILVEGTTRARELTQTKLEKIKQAMGFGFKL
jgi:tryptophanyl-tRNA synthetase